jgi:hypothetical protein
MLKTAVMATTDGQPTSDAQASYANDPIARVTAENGSHLIPARAAGRR